MQLTTNVKENAKKKLPNKSWIEAPLKAMKKSQMQSQEVSKLMELITAYLKKDHLILVQFLTFSGIPQTSQYQQMKV